MLSGKTTEPGLLKGKISSTDPLIGKITSDDQNLKGELSLSTMDVPYYETSNAAGGTTVYIGKVV